MNIDYKLTKIHYALFCILWLINFVAAKINFANPNASLILSGTNASLILSKSLDNFGGSLKITDKSATSIVQTTSNAAINFAKTGTVKYGVNNSCKMLSPNNAVYITGGQSYNLTGNNILGTYDPIKVSGTDNLIYGSPAKTPPIILQDATTTMTLAINGKLTSNITMNGGTIYLQNDLLLKDDVHITGSGTIVFNGYNLTYPVYQQPITSELTCVNANDITVNVRTAQTTNTSFNSANIMGTGVILNFTGGGSYTVRNGATIYVNGLHFKGLGSNGGGRIILSTATSNAYFTNCIFELNGTFTQTAGLWCIEGGCCKVISGSADKFVVSGAGTTLRINGQVLQYECRNSFPLSPFSVVSSGTIALTNGGTIASNYIPGGPMTLNVYNPSSVGPNYTDVNLYCNYRTNITFYNENIATPKSMIFDGNNTWFDFGIGTSNQPVTVMQNVTLTVQNVTFRNFDPNRFVLQGSGSSQAKIIFGDNVIIEIPDDTTFATGSLTLTGTTTIYGPSNSTMYLASQAITFTGASRTLKLHGLRIKCSAFDSLKSLSDTSTIQFQDSEVYLTNTGLTIDKGYLHVLSNVKIGGVSETVVDGTVPLTFSSKGLFTIKSNSTLELGSDVIFNYSPDTSQDSGVVATQKRHFVMTDYSSVLSLNRTTINTSPTGLAIDHGKVYVNDVATINTSYNTGYEFELGNAVNLSILGGGMLNINGLLKYVAST